MTALLSFSIGFALFCVIAAMLLCGIRLLIGPSAQDRVIALDTLWMCGMLLTIMQGIRFGNVLYFEIALLIAVVGFISSVALAKFLMRGEVIE